MDKKRSVDIGAKEIFIYVGALVESITNKRSEFGVSFWGCA